MSKLFIYYSYSGNGDYVAEALKEKGFVIRKVESKFKMGKKMFPQLMKGGFSSLIGAKPQLINYDNQIDDFDEIYVGSPIWNDRLACPTNTILKETDFKDKKLTFILYSGSGKAKSAVKKINKLYPNSGIIHLKQPKDFNQEIDKL